MSAGLRHRLRAVLERWGPGVGLAILAAVAVAPLLGPGGGRAVGVVLVVASVVGLLAVSRRDGCTVLTWLVVLLLLVPQPYVLVGPLKSVGNPATLVALAALAIWAASRVLGLSPAHERHPVRWVLLVFAISASASYAAGLVRDLTRAEQASMDRVVFWHLALLGVGLLAVDALGSRDRITTLLQRVVLVGGAAGAIGIVEFASPGFSFRDAMLLPGLTSSGDLETVTRSGFDRVAAAASHPIELSVVCAALVPLALHFALHARVARWRYWLAMLALLAVIPMTVSRSGVLGVVVAVGVYSAVLSHRGRFNALVLSVLGLAVFRAMVPGVLGTVRSLFRDVDTDPSIAGRTDDYQAVPGLMDGHWVWGRGLGTFSPDVYFFLDNQYLAALLQGGLVGLTAFIALLVVGLATARGVRSRAADPALRSEGQALTAAVASLAVSALAFDALSFRQSAFLLFLLIGCAGAHWSLVRDLPKVPRRSRTGPDPGPAGCPAPVSPRALARGQV